MSIPKKDPRLIGTRKPLPSNVCPSCRSRRTEGEAFCGQCNFPFQASTEEKKRFLVARKQLVDQYATAMSRIRFGAGVLIFIGIVGIIQTVIYGLRFLNLSPNIFEIIAIVISIFLALLYIALGIISRKHGIVPFAIGTVFFFLEFLLSLLNGFNIFFIAKIFLLVCLVIAFVASISAQQTKTQIEQMLGKDFFEKLRKQQE